jgi:hypothetical protein
LHWSIFQSKNEAETGLSQSRSRTEQGASTSATFLIYK